MSGASSATVRGARVHLLNEGGRVGLSAGANRLTLGTNHERVVSGDLVGAIQYGGSINAPSTYHSEQFGPAAGKRAILTFTARCSFTFMSQEKAPLEWAMCAEAYHRQLSPILSRYGTSYKG